jgi:hypothetical protein
MINEIVSGFTSSPVEVSIVLGLMVVGVVEVRQLRALAEELEQPHKRYMLLKNQALFDRAAVLAEESGKIDPGGRRRALETSLFGSVC